MKVEMHEMGHRSLVDCSSLESGIILSALEEYKNNPDNSERDKNTIERMVKKIRGES